MGGKPVLLEAMDENLAVNADPSASIFSVATYGVKADIFEFAAALRAQFRS